MLPKISDRCAVCGASKIDGEAVWMVEHPSWAHPRCVDWAQRPFPYDWKLRRLRTLARILNRTYREIVFAGRFLLDTQRRWPAEANDRLREINVRDISVQQALAKLRDKLSRGE